MAQVPRTNWVAYLLAVLLVELSNMLARESPSDATEKLDNYESIKESFKGKDLSKKNFSNKRKESGNYPYFKSKESTRDFKPKFQAKPEVFQDKQREFDERKTLHCYECGSSNHLRPQCDKLKKTPESISHVTDKSFDELMAHYTNLGKVNGVEKKILCDTGATLDLICNKYVKPHMYTNEKVWLRTPLEGTFICLPLAEVELDCEMGHVITKAAVLRDSLDQGRYFPRQDCCIA
ncbi:SCAN box domain-containing protein [Trichonephila clavata]|uniref:SCAN box domain-containing protein n=1 Tax=Trichonephila clavata TaxID=2740835 RepID=A0A8X6FUT9_TRICU|nr:SCAN box domain-containing protein [Trichonephila clavata]